MERYALVKGDNELLDEELKREFIGINQSKYGFTGLTRDVQRVRQVFGSSVLIEKASLDDIMLYTVRGTAMFNLLIKDIIVQKKTFWYLLFSFCITAGAFQYYYGC